MTTLQTPWGRPFEHHMVNQQGYLQGGCGGRSFTSFVDLQQVRAYIPHLRSRPEKYDQSQRLRQRIDLTVIAADYVLGG
jgi:hypothetical protein